MVSKQDAPKSLFEMKDLEPEPESPFLDEAAYDLPTREEAWDSYEAEPEPQLETPFASALAEDGQLASLRKEQVLSPRDTEERESVIAQNEEEASPEELPFLDRELESLQDANEEEEASFLEGKVEEEAEESNEQAAVSNSYFRIANDITSAFEGGKPDTLNLRDNGIISYGKHQATLSAGTLFFILKRYSELSRTDASRRLTSYLDRVRRKDEGLRSDKTFLQLLKDAAHEPEMSRAQDEVFATRYWNPAKTAAAQMGVRSALGHVLFYNTRVQGGLGSVLRRTTKQLAGKVGDVIAGRRITEHDFLTAFVGQFINHRLANSARNAARARQLEQEALALERQAAAAEPGVAKKLLREAHGRRRKAARNAVNAKALKRSATKTRGPTFKALVASGDLGLQGDAEGFVRLVGKPGVKIQGLRAGAVVDEIPSELAQEWSSDQRAALLAAGLSEPQDSLGESEYYAEEEQPLFFEGKAEEEAGEEDEEDVNIEVGEDTEEEAEEEVEEEPESLEGEELEALRPSRPSAKQAIDGVLGPGWYDEWQQIEQDTAKEKKRAAINHARFAKLKAPGQTDRLWWDVRLLESVANDYRDAMNRLAQGQTVNREKVGQIHDVLTFALGVVTHDNDALDAAFAAGLVGALVIGSFSILAQRAQRLEELLKVLKQRLEEAKRERIEAWVQGVLDAAITSVTLLTPQLHIILRGGILLSQWLYDDALGPSTSTAATIGTKASITVSQFADAVADAKELSRRTRTIARKTGKAAVVAGFAFDANEILVGYRNVERIQRAMAQAKKAYAKLLWEIAKHKPILLKFQRDYQRWWVGIADTRANADKIRYALDKEMRATGYKPRI